MSDRKYKNFDTSGLDYDNSKQVHEKHRNEAIEEINNRYPHINKHRALISGAAGQDCASLSKILLEKGYEVYLTDRRISTPSNRYWRLEELGIKDKVTILYATLENYASILEAVRVSRPTEIYHLAAQSFVTNSFEDEFSTLSININGTHNFLRAMRELEPYAKFYTACSSEQFGVVEKIPQDETTNFHPRSVYGISKCTAFELTRHYRELGFHCSNGILFNHEGPYRGRQFVTRKITASLVECVIENKKFKLGNIDSKRDWGDSSEYCLGMWKMLQQEQADDYVLATNETHSIREFLDEAAIVLGNLVGKKIDWKNYVEYDEALKRPCEVDLLIGNPQKAKDKLGWEPKVKFKELVKIMIEADYRRYKDGTLKFKS